MCLNAIKKSNVYHPRKEFHFMKIDETMIFKFSAYVKYIFEFFNYISNTYMIHKWSSYSGLIISMSRQL